MQEETKAFKALLETANKLLDPEDGCPWDLKQTHHSLKPCLIEETYEVADAIDREDSDNLREELGDLLYQVVFHANLAERAGKFNMADVVNDINEKLIRRHPHIFGDATVEDSDEVMKNWEAIKLEEKKKKGLERKYYYDSLPKFLPALEKSYQIQKKAGKIGFQWENMGDVLMKLEEELEELKEAVTAQQIEHIEEEMGDLLFVLVNTALFLKVHPESALHKTNTKFLDRFRYIEEKLEERKITLAEATLAEMDLLWNEKKGKDKNAKEQELGR